MNLKNFPKRWITADWHLGEERLELLGRPFKNQKEHIDALIANHNSVVSKDDLVIVVGDAVSKIHPEFIPYCDSFNGTKILIRGNHDAPYTDKQFLSHFDSIIEEGAGLELKIGDLDCWIIHYPTRSRKDKFNLVGHIHSAWKVQLNSYNVGVDANHFFPVDMDKSVPFVYKAICDFYDEDVWVAYDESNNSFKGKRGKDGSYFKK